MNDPTSTTKQVDNIDILEGKNSKNNQLYVNGMPSLIFHNILVPCIKMNLFYMHEGKAKHLCDKIHK